ncbi:hypothetical protein [Nitrosopumilus ureiphilus]|uniref:Uncharacterized protein n=1 Tax=Nitrosopumilus ureiphilus TaxID=1470067 RepID=A0A7D5M601_9ARCH|nr:hypothetical protein [Nitrosopumilus ureiphilus]QLH07512.1 hypothetical protein C5F50_10850 [Nitrosopumilus ureiphilus]
MNVVLEVGTKNYADDLLSIKKSLSHMESLLGCYNGYVLSEPSTKFGWTFFKLAFKPELQTGIEEKFSDMIEKYQWSDQPQKFVKFVTDYFLSRGCNVKIKLSD